MIDHEDPIEFYDPKEEGVQWSVSSLKAIHSCGKQWYYRYRTDEGPKQTPYLSFGGTVHKVIELVHRNNNFTDAFWQPLWNDMWYEASKEVDWTGMSKIHFNNLGPKIIGKYVDANQDIDLLEIEIEFPLDNEECKIGRFPIRGIIDQIRRTDEGRLLVVDLKTAKYPLDQLVLDSDPQFTFYWWYVKQKYGEDALLGLYHLQSGNILYTSRTDSDIEKLEAIIAEGQSKIDQEMFSKNVGETCKWCPFAQVCLGNNAGNDTNTTGIKEL